MATLRNALTTITEGLAAVLEPVTGGAAIDVAEHPGRFTEAELGQIVMKKRAVRVAIEALPQITVTGPGHIEADLLVSAFVICGDSAAGQRHQAAIDLVEQIALAVPHQRWGVRYLRPAMSSTISVDNLYNGEIDAKGVALWAIAWQQRYSTQK